MIKEFASYISNWYYEKGMLTSEHSIEVYRYGFELLVSTLVNVCVLGIIGMLINCGMQAVFFCTGFVILRIFAGGYHAKTHSQCILLFNSSFLLVVIFDKVLRIMNAEILLIGLVLAASIVVIILAPVGVANKFTSDLLNLKNRRISIAISSLNLGLVIIMYFGMLNNVKLADTTYYFWGYIVASLFLIIATITRRKSTLVKGRNYYEKESDF